MSRSFEQLRPAEALVQHEPYNANARFERSSSAVTVTFSSGRPHQLIANDLPVGNAVRIRIYPTGIVDIPRTT